MNVYEIIDKKKRGLELNQTEIEYLINGYVNNEIPDYQISAWLMAVYFQGMTDRELLALTNCMTKSGEIVDLSSIMGVKVDKHSTGGVGDKVTLVVAPIVAACGGKVAKMSGRGLGFTGGTIDKLEAIPGLKTALAEEDFFNMVNEIGLAVMGQSADIAPADKKLYALRDVTATVDSIPLIASSIMSKKLAAGSDKIVLDVTVGSGAFMKDKENAVQLAEKMVAIGNGAGKKTVAILTNMDVPLGKMVGNNLEVVEAIETLKGRGPEDLIAVVVEIASTMLYLAQIGTKEECMKKVKRVIADGSALEKLKLNDASLEFEPETSKALGFGFRCGFLGLLHMEIIEERIEREFGIELIATSPSVIYDIELTDGSNIKIDSPVKMPEKVKIKDIKEPYITPSCLPINQLNVVLRYIPN